MAYGAKVPILPISLDYVSKAAKVGNPIELTGDVAADLDTVKAFYLSVRPKNVRNA
jgi:hypothetical protein